MEQSLLHCAIHRGKNVLQLRRMLSNAIHRGKSATVRTVDDDPTVDRRSFPMLSDPEKCALCPKTRRTPMLGVIFRTGGSPNCRKHD